MKSYKYKYVGTSGITVLGQEANYIGDVISIPIKNFSHKLFKSMDGGKSYPKNINDLKGKFKGKKCLLVGRGESSQKIPVEPCKYDAVIAVNPRANVLRMASPGYVVYLENNYSIFINRNIELFKDIKVIGNDLALNCEKVDYHYGKNEVIEGASSGFYALQIALLMGFKSIDLIGYDYTGDEYPKETFDLWLKDFDRLKDNKLIKQLNKKSRLFNG